jgi:hypothetical protein
MQHSVDEDNLDRAISALRAVRPTDAPLGDSPSLLEEIMSNSTLHEVSAPAEATNQPRGRRSWLISGGVAAAAAAIAAVVVTGGSNPPVASAAEVLSAAAAKTQDLSSFRSTVEVDSSEYDGVGTMDVNGDDYRVTVQTPTESSEMIYASGDLYLSENNGPWKVYVDDQEQVPSLAEASSDLVDAAVKNSTVTEIGREGDTVLYQVTVDDALVDRLSALPYNVADAYSLWILEESAEDGLRELVVGVDQSSDLLTKIQFTTNAGSVVEQEITTPAKPFEAPANAVPAKVAPDKVATGNK